MKIAVIVIIAIAVCETIRAFVWRHGFRMLQLWIEDKGMTIPPRDELPELARRELQRSFRIGKGKSDL